MPGQIFIAGITVEYSLKMIKILLAGLDISPEMTPAWVTSNSDRTLVEVTVHDPASYAERTFQDLKSGFQAEVVGSANPRKVGSLPKDRPFSIMLRRKLRSR